MTADGRPNCTPFVLAINRTIKSIKTVRSRVLNTAGRCPAACVSERVASGAVSFVISPTRCIEPLSGAAPERCFTFIESETISYLLPGRNRYPPEIPLEDMDLIHARTHFFVN